MALVIAAGLLMIGCEQASDSSPSSSPPAKSPAKGAAADGARGSGAERQTPAGGNQTSGQTTSTVSDIDQQYGVILSAVVSEEGLVRYPALAQEPLKTQLDAVVIGYSSEKLPSESEQAARIALWCNVYNANMLKIALEESRKEAFTTLKDAPDLFEQHQITVAGESMTLNDLEDRLRALKDPRIHAALVFGARSCPPLRNEPYAADRLDEQLDQQSFAWLDDYGKNRLTHDALLLSQIFEWNAADFAVEPYDGPLGFIRKHARPNGLLREFVRKVPEARIRYVEFNWALNNAGED